MEIGAGIAIAGAWILCAAIGIILGLIKISRHS